MYKVKDNVYWETESSKLRLNDVLLSGDSSTTLVSNSQNMPAPVPGQNTRENGEGDGPCYLGINKPEEVITSLRPLSASRQLQSDTVQAMLIGADSEKILSFIPTAEQETNAWEVIQKWHLVAEERRNQRPNIDIYSAANDECISTTSLLTYSVTEAPSISAYSYRLVSIIFLL